LLATFGVGALVAAAALYDFNQWKAPLARRLSGISGYDFAVNGAIRMKWSIVPTLLIEDIVAKNVTWAHEENILEIQRVEVQPSIMAALAGAFVAKSVLIEDVRVNFQSDGDGRVNWRQDIHQALSPGSAAAAAVVPVALQRLDVHEVKLRFRSDWAQSEETYTIDDFVIAAAAPSAPIAVSLSAVLKDFPFNFSGTIGTPQNYLRNEAASVALQGAYGVAEMNFSGAVQRPRTLEGMDIQFLLEAESLNDFGTVALGSAGNFDLPKDQPVRVSARAVSGDNGPYLENIELRVGGIILRPQDP